MTTKPLRIALTKGRLEKDTVALMEPVGLVAKVCTKKAAG